MALFPCSVLLPERISGHTLPSAGIVATLHLRHLILILIRLLRRAIRRLSFNIFNRLHLALVLILSLYTGIRQVFLKKYCY